MREYQKLLLFCLFWKVFRVLLIHPNVFFIINFPSGSLTFLKDLSFPWMDASSNFSQFNFLLMLIRICGGYEHHVEHVRALMSPPWMRWSRWVLFVELSSVCNSFQYVWSKTHPSVPSAVFGFPWVSRGRATPPLGVPVPGPDPVCSRHDLWLHTVPAPEAYQQSGLATSHEVLVLFTILCCNHETK